MSIENVKAFYLKLREDDELAKKLDDAQKAYTGDPAAMFDTVIRPIAEHEGFHFTLEDAHAVINATKKSHAGEELTDEELEMVAGGKMSEHDRDILINDTCNALYNAYQVVYNTMIEDPVEDDE